MKKLNILFIVFAFFVTGFANLASPRAETMPTPATNDYGHYMMILDGSGSMWGQIDGKTKIEIARDAVDDVLKTLPENLMMGFMSYGHRREADCQDIELLAPVEKVSHKAISEQAHAIKPKGKTPIADSLIQAADHLSYEKEKATIILVSDGIETCHPDLCAVAKALSEKGKDLTMHVIGFGLKNDEAKTLQCVADLSGGKFLPARNAKELEESFGQLVQEFQEIPVKTRDGILFKTILDPNFVKATEGDNTNTDSNEPFSYSIYPVNGPFTRANLIVSRYEETPIIPLDPGDYSAVLQRGHIYYRHDFHITETTEEIIIPINVGEVDLRLKVADNLAEEIARGSGWEIYALPMGIEDAANFDPKQHQPLTRSHNGLRRLMVAGDYIAFVRVNDLDFSFPFTVKGNEKLDEDLNLHAGMIRVEPNFLDEAEAQKWKYATWLAYPAGGADPKAKPTLTIVKERNYVIKPGDYVLATKRTNLEWQIIDNFTVAEGQKLTLTPAPPSLP